MEKSDGREGTEMKLIWKELLHANFRFGRMCADRARLLTGCCRLPSDGTRMCPRM